VQNSSIAQTIVGGQNMKFAMLSQQFYTHTVQRKPSGESDSNLAYWYKLLCLVNFLVDNRLVSSIYSPTYDMLLWNQIKFYFKHSNRTHSVEIKLFVTMFKISSQQAWDCITVYSSKLWSGLFYKCKFFQRMLLSNERTQ